MIFLRIIITVLVILGSGFLSLDIVERAFDISDIVKVDGVLNIWGTYGLFLIGLYGLMYWLGQIIELPFPIGNFTKVIVVIGVILSPLLTVVTYAKVHTDIAGYVECSSLRKVSLHYSSRTYAISKELCLTEAKDR
ncbi:hypothetical protein ACFODT_08565 [Vibrio zhugei]|uniref:Uncharacterized protein n=1 Tax=Vibrio zhugei TaxID=2479546 RepID=A0ABV7C9F4_9VIBR|nr:hypothetical protein [Vibrio zhugei]